MFGKKDKTLDKVKKDLRKEKFVCLGCGYIFDLSQIKDYFNDGKHQGPYCPNEGCNQVVFKRPIKND